MKYDDDDCVHADEYCAHRVPDETVDVGEVAADVCPSGCPHYRPRGRRPPAPDEAMRAGVPPAPPAPAGPCPYAGGSADDDGDDGDDDDGFYGPDRDADDDDAGDLCFGPFCGMPGGGGSCSSCPRKATAPWQVDPGDRPHMDPRVPWTVHRAPYGCA